MPEINIDRSISFMDGTQRVLDENSTLEKTKDNLKSIGVTRIASITDLDRLGIPVFSSIRPSAAEGAISVYSGKGSNETQARISSMMEGFERCLAEKSGINENVKDEIKAIHVVESYENLIKENQVVSPQSLIIAESYNPTALIEWVQGWDLLKNEEPFVPANSVYHPYEAPGRTLKLFRSNTNGLAAGNTIEEAIFHGLLEVIERDALSIAEFTRNPGKEIILTEEDGENYEILRKFTDNEVDVKIWALNHDTDITTVVVATDDVRLKDAALLVMGAGTHLKPEIAVRRALTEAAQSRVVQIHGAREDTDREGFVRDIGYDRIKRMNKYWYADGEKVSVSELKDLSKTTPAESIDVIDEQLKKVTDSAIVVDLSRESIPVPVVRVIIPTFEMYTLDRERVGNRVKSGPRKKMAPHERPWRKGRRK
ncbi:putative methanogenesis marker protein 1 [Methanolobus tindarius DSM 2278]|jgi:ribosomal protein S12 methylthiotransferase accessory factor|uniref:Putative methanogenesis marker protein 1 n=1 Tax=Methanolobus tindarius DSM 2278 TaxID=1090322 RepID=W9DVW6_METTI|nr:YcaO-related McrA-glycine thioamidation protein [Methanolobus tindarius]ETA67536.1 putative methanogenesis marker protein 1 [Methanolobus tindarius DSM 2278]